MTYKPKEMKRIRLSLIVVLSVFCVQWSVSGNKIGQETTPQVKNVIVMIGDGMGVSQVFAGIYQNTDILTKILKLYGFEK